MRHAFIVGFRDRGLDPLRPANIAYVLHHLETLNLGPVYVTGDGRADDAPFCRSAAYNHGAQLAFDGGADTLTFYEADLIVARHQISDALELAQTPGLVVPFTRFLAITAEDSQKIRAHQLEPAEADSNQIRADCKSIGAVNTMSRDTLESVGQWDEQFQGAWYDDDAMEHAFRVCAGATRFVDGPAYHLYHLPGARGPHLTNIDREATARNKNRYHLYQQAHTAQRIRELTAGGT